MGFPLSIFLPCIVVKFAEGVDQAKGDFFVGLHFYFDGFERFRKIQN